MTGGKHGELSLRQSGALQQAARALSSPVRLQILQALGQRSLNVQELAQTLDVPLSTVALGVRVLEEAGFIATQAQPGRRGAMKLCSRRLDSLRILLTPPPPAPEACLTARMPIGGYSLADGVAPTCGLAGAAGPIGEADDPRAFYLPERLGAQLAWFRQGFLEYRLALPALSRVVPTWLEVSFEACSEAPLHRDPWPSDVALEVNGRRLGLWRCPCDCGGRRGALTPAWWSEAATQFGFLKTWRVDGTGAYLDQDRLSDVTLPQLALSAQPYISLRLGVPPEAACVGGLNLFGEGFGDYPQGLVVRLGYRLPEGETAAPEEKATGFME